MTKKLFLGHSFNNKLKNLPTNLQILKLDYSYEQSLDNLLESIELLILENRRLPINNLPMTTKVYYDNTYLELLSKLFILYILNNYKNIEFLI